MSEVGFIEIPDEQTFVMEIIAEKDFFLRAELVGGMLRSLSRLLKACATPENPIEVAVLGVVVEGGKARITVGILPRIASPEAEG